MAVLNHFAACGWSLEQVRHGLGGQFPGLSALYGSTDRQERLLATEWAKACAFTQKPAPLRRAVKSARINNTSQPLPTGGASGSTSKAGVHQLVNDLENVLYAVLDHRLKDHGREGLSLRLLLRAVLGYMRTMETISSTSGAVPSLPPWANTTSRSHGCCRCWRPPQTGS